MIQANIESGMIVVPSPSGAVLIELDVKLRRTHELKESQTSEHPPLYFNSQWQFADYNHPPIEKLGPDYSSGDKPFMTFSFRRGTMHGHDGKVFFHRLYEFDNEIITFKPDPKFCQDGACFDTLHKFPSSKNKWPQTRFLGRYNIMMDVSHCLRFEDENGERFTPVFSETGRIGYDDFGIYVVDPVTGAKLRGGDDFRLSLQTRPVDPETHKFGMPCQDGRLRLVEP